MQQQPYTIVIPARYDSQRFPGKPLHPLNGVPMILHTAKRAAESSAELIVIATDDERIARVCTDAGLDVEMTRKEHPSGTDRIAEVAARRQWDGERIIVGLQGDEPATPAAHLDNLAANLQMHNDADMATLCMRIESNTDYADPNRVKVVRDHREMAMYFSRASIPAQRNTLLGQVETSDATVPECWLHIGMYAYRCAYLSTYQQLTPCDLEREEQLEQLRVLYNGGRIHVGSVESSPARGVDSLADVPVLEALLAQS